MKRPVRTIFPALLSCLALQLTAAPPANAYNLGSCRTTDTRVSYQLSTSELSYRDYLPLARQAAEAWEGTQVVDMVEIGINSNRDVLIGALDYGASANYNGITQPIPGCYQSYGGTFPIQFSYTRLNTYATDGMPSSRVLYIFEHELGHLLGLNHPDTNQSCVSSPAVMMVSELGYEVCGVRGLRPDDLYGVRAAFS